MRVHHGLEVNEYFTFKTLHSSTSVRQDCRRLSVNCILVVRWMVVGWGSGKDSVALNGQGLA